MLAFPFFVRAREVFDGAVFEDEQPRGDFVDEIVVVGDEQDGAFVFLQGDVEGGRGLDE